MTCIGLINDDQECKYRLAWVYMPLIYSKRAKKIRGEELYLVLG